MSSILPLFSIIKSSLMFLTKTISTPTESSNNNNDTDEGSSISDIAKDIKYSTITPINREGIDRADIAIETIMTVSNNTGAFLQEKVEQQKKELKETLAATERQRSLRIRIRKFLASMGPTRIAVGVGVGMGVGFTIYYLLRYGEVPLGGFIKRVLKRALSDAASEAISDPTPPAPISNPLNSTLIPNGTPINQGSSLFPGLRFPSRISSAPITPPTNTPGPDITTAFTTLVSLGAFKLISKLIK